MVSRPEVPATSISLVALNVALSVVLILLMMGRTFAPPPRLTTTCLRLGGRVGAASNPEPRTPLSIWRIMTSSRRGGKKLACFYCNKRSDIIYDGLITEWECANCDAINYLDKVQILFSLIRTILLTRRAGRRNYRSSSCYRKRGTF